MTPMCKSSKFLVDQLNRMEIKFKSYNILEDGKLKEWLKFYANWPSYPQLFINGKFIGGTEIILQLCESEEFLRIVPPECIKENVLARINTAMTQSVVVLFMKGTPKDPFDGYQKEAVDILNDQKVRFTHYNIMPDPDVREIIKEYSRWPAFPMMYINSKFIGGLNFMKE